MNIRHREFAQRGHELILKMKMLTTRSSEKHNEHHYPEFAQNGTLMQVAQFGKTINKWILS